MSHRNFSITGALLLLVAFLLLWFWPDFIRSGWTKVSALKTQPAPSPVSVSTPQPEQSFSSLTPRTLEQVKLEKLKQVTNKVIAALNTPITFYGKVVDESGKEISNVRVGYALLDNFNSSGSTGHLSANETGHFEISGVKGAVIGVNVSKEGYYQIPVLSHQSFAYGIEPDGTIKLPPVKGSPAVFVLQRKGLAEPLIYLSSRQVEVPATSKSTLIDLATGRVGQGELEIRSQLSGDFQHRYDWRFVLSVKGGGLIERLDDFQFEAPQDGYESSAEVSMSASDPAWKSSVTKSYFAHLPNGNYVRLQIQFYPRDYRNMVVLESYLNPKPGNRNLEYDPQKTLPNR